MRDGVLAVAEAVGGMELRLGYKRVKRDGEATLSFLFFSPTSVLCRVIVIVVPQLPFLVSEITTRQCRRRTTHTSPQALYQWQCLPKARNRTSHLATLATRLHIASYRRRRQNDRRAFRHRLALDCIPQHRAAMLVVITSRRRPVLPASICSTT